MEDKKDRRGGARPGAGRPRGDSRMISFRAPGRLAAQLKGMDKRTEFICQTLDKAIRAQERVPGAAGDAVTKAVGHAVTESIGLAVPASRVRSRTLPYFDIRVVAGFPVPLDNDERAQEIDIISMLCPHPEASYLIRVNGDSMIDAGVLSGDIVIVDKSCRNPSPSQVAVCELNGEYTLKRFEIRDGEGWLIPANPSFPEIRVTEADSFSIWGTVTYVIHKPHSK